MSSESMELEPSHGDFKPPKDKRPHLPEPPPVRLLAVEDVHLPAVSGLSEELDAFYIGMLRFVREHAEAAIVYRAENFRLRFDIRKPPLDRDDFRPALIDIPDIAYFEKMLVDREIEFERHRGLSPGRDRLVLRDPAGNWVSIGEMREMR